MTAGNDTGSKPELNDEQQRNLMAAERQIQRILIALKEDHGLTAENVEIDTRRLANFTVSIFVTEGDWT